MSCGEREKAANFDSLFDGSDAHLLPSNIAECAAKLRQYNRWRRGEDWSPEEDGPNPKELGLLIDYAAAALDEVREIERQRDELLAAAEAIEINSEECLDFDECTAMLVPIDDYHKLTEAIASVKGQPA